MTERLALGTKQTFNKRLDSRPWTTTCQGRLRGNDAGLLLAQSRPSQWTILFILNVRSYPESRRSGNPWFKVRYRPEADARNAGVGGSSPPIATNY